MNRRNMVLGSLSVLAAGIVGDGIPNPRAMPTSTLTQKGFASILDIAHSANEPRGVGISFPIPFGNYGPQHLSYIIISQYNIKSIALTKPNPYGSRFTVTAGQPGEFECSIVWTASN